MIPEDAAKKVVAKLPMVRPTLSRKRKNIALAFAMIVDAIQIGAFPFFIGGGLEPPFLDDVLDPIAAIALLIICGFRWQFLLAFVIELVPGIALFPTWTAFVLMLPVKKEDGAPELPEGEAESAPETLAAKKVTAEVIRVGKPE